MSLLGELALTAVSLIAGGASMHGVAALRRKTSELSRPTPQPLADDSMPYSAYYGVMMNGEKAKGEPICPKCLTVNDIQDRYCECAEHHTGHFHFECSGCTFKTIMRTADSK